MTQSKPKLVPTKPKRIPASKVKKVPTKVDKKFEENEVAKPTSFDTNKFKYAQETLVGEPTIHPPGGIAVSYTNLTLPTTHYV